MKTKEKDECSYSFSNAIRTLVMVRVTGLEPARRGHQNLNLARLPIPPYPRVRLVYPFCGYLSILMMVLIGSGALAKRAEICADAARAHKRVDTCGFHPLENHPFPLDSLAQTRDRRPLRNKGTSSRGYRCVAFSAFSQFTDNILLHIRATPCSVRHDSAAQLFDTL